jgi:hypothetical protein
MRVFAGNTGAPYMRVCDNLEASFTAAAGAVDDPSAGDWRIVVSWRMSTCDATSSPYAKACEVCSSRIRSGRDKTTTQPYDFQ